MIGTYVFINVYDYENMLVKYERTINVYLQTNFKEY